MRVCQLIHTPVACEVCNIATIITPKPVAEDYGQGRCAIPWALSEIFRGAFLFVPGLFLRTAFCKRILFHNFIFEPVRFQNTVCP